MADCARCQPAAAKPRRIDVANAPWAGRLPRTGWTPASIAYASESAVGAANLPGPPVLLHPRALWQGSHPIGFNWIQLGRPATRGKSSVRAGPQSEPTVPLPNPGIAQSPTRTPVAFTSSQD